MSPRRILIAGVGNVFLGDDGFGVEVVRRLMEVELPECVVVADFGIRSFDLAYALIEEWELIIIVDAARSGRAPGTLYWIEPDLADGAPNEVFYDGHTLHPAAVIEMARHYGDIVARVLLLACEPLAITEDQGMRLSSPVQAAAHSAVEMIRELIVLRAQEQTTPAPQIV